MHTERSLLGVVLWAGSLLTLSSGFHQSSNIHRNPATRISTKTTTTTLFNVPEPLAREGSWQAYLDEETTGLVYYFDTATGESRWEPPTESFPEVRLPRRKQRLADNLRKEYRKTRQMEADGSGSATSVQEKPTVGWFDNIFNDGGASEETVEDPEPEEKVEVEEEVAPKTIFDSFFGTGPTSEADEGAVTQATAEEDESEQERKSGLLDSFSTPFFVNTADRVGNQVQEKIVNASPKPIEIDIGAHILPHPEKVRWGGEDATFVKGRTFGVFDGVSGAEKLDGVPLYSRTLANEMKKQCGTSGETVQDMTAYLTSAASYADGAATGASTAVVASIGENGFLQALNVGDSCCMVIRDGKVTAKTREISHYWECPYQLSEDSPDQPKDGTKLNVELIAGDLVIMGSDGVFDNVNDDTLLDLVAESPAAKPTPLAKKICDVSRKVSLDNVAVTPYSKQAQRRGDADYRDGLGGKVDDVSCIVVVCK